MRLVLGRTLSYDCRPRSYLVHISDDVASAKYPGSVTCTYEYCTRYLFFATNPLGRTAADQNEKTKEQTRYPYIRIFENPLSPQSTEGVFYPPDKFTETTIPRCQQTKYPPSFTLLSVQAPQQAPRRSLTISTHSIEGKSEAPSPLLKFARARTPKAPGQKYRKSRETDWRESARPDISQQQDASSTSLSCVMMTRTFLVLCLAAQGLLMHVAGSASLPARPPLGKHGEFLIELVRIPRPPSLCFVFYYNWATGVIY